MNNEVIFEEKIVTVDQPGADQPAVDETSHWNAPTVKSNKNTTSKETPATTLFVLIRKYASVSDALRVMGALAVATAMGLFLLEGVEVQNDLYRFLTMLGLTAALTTAGLLMSTILKEQRGSRMFIGLGLLSIPVNFTVFGALIYSIVPQDVVTFSYPSYAHWQVTNASEVPLALVAGIAVLLPVVWLGFTVLARSERLWLSTTLLISSAFLMIPVRQELFSAGIAIASAASIFWLVRRNHNNSLALKTPEGRFALALLFIAPIIIAVRSLFLYEASGILMLTLAGLFYFFTRQLISQRNESNFYSATLTIVASLAALFISVTAADVFAFKWLNQWSVILGSVCVLLLALDINKVSPHRRVANTVSVLMVGIATAAMVMLALSTSVPGLIAAAAAILVMVCVYGYLFKKFPVIGLALVGIIAILALNAQNIWLAASQTGWWGIGAIGAIAIISGSMLDRAGTITETRSPNKSAT